MLAGVRSRALGLAGRAMGATLLLTGCSSAFYVGDPSAAPNNYFNVERIRRPEMPLEDQFASVDPSRTQVLDEPPRTPWRPLGDVRTTKTNPADALAELKQWAANYGADGLLRFAAGQGPTTLTRSGEAWSVPIRGVNISGSGSSERLETSYGVAGTAIRRAKPGSEVTIGIGCTGYSAMDVNVYGALDKWLVPYVTAVAGPAARAGVQRGDFIMSFEIEGVARRLSGSCVGLNEQLQGAGPGRTVILWLWRPGGAPVDRMVRVPQPRTVGIRLDATKEGLRVGEVVAGSPAVGAGFKVGDIVESVGGTPLRDVPQAIELIRRGPPEQRLTVRRDGATLVLTVQTWPRADVNVRDVFRPYAIVAGVTSAGGSPEVELQPGDQLLEYATSAQFEQALKAHNFDMPLRVRREGTVRVVKVRLEAIPDARYRVGTAIYERGAGPAPVPAGAAPPVAPPAAPPPAAPAAGCAKDTECKGDRICVKGECVDPKPR